MAIPRYSAELKVVLAVVILFLGWLFAAMIPKGESAWGRFQKPLISKNLESSSAQAGKDAEIPDFNGKSEDESTASTKNDVADVLENSDYQLLWDSPQKKNWDSEKNEIVIDDPSGLFASSPLTETPTVETEQKSDGADSSGETSSPDSLAWANELKIDNEKLPEIEPGKRPKWDDKIPLTESTEGKSDEESASANVLVPPETRKLEEFLKKTDLAKDDLTSPESLDNSDKGLSDVNLPETDGAKTVVDTESPPLSDTSGDETVRDAGIAQNAPSTDAIASGETAEKATATELATTVKSENVSSSEGEEPSEVLEAGADEIVRSGDSDFSDTVTASLAPSADSGLTPSTSGTDQNGSSPASNDPILSQDTSANPPANEPNRPSALASASTKPSGDFYSLPTQRPPQQSGESARVGEGSSAGAIGAIGTASNRSRQLVPANRPVDSDGSPTAASAVRPAVTASSSPVATAEYRDTGDSSGGILPVGALVPYELPNQVATATSSASGTESVRQLKPSSTSPIRLPQAKIRVYTAVAVERWEDIVQKFGLSEAESVRYAQINEARMNPDKTVSAGTKLMLPDR